MLNKHLKEEQTTMKTTPCMKATTFVILLVSLLISSSFAVPVLADEAVILQYIGHSCTLITAPDGTRIVSDPYRNYQAPREIAKFPDNIEADAVTVSHFHADHNNVSAIIGDPQVLNMPGSYQVGMVTITGYKADHGNPEGLDPNTVFVFEIETIKIVHMGAAGVVTQPDILEAMQNADVILIDVQGDALHSLDKEMEHMEQVNARTVIPTHYSFSTNARFFGGATIEESLELLPPDTMVVREGSEIQVTPNMPKQVVVMTPLALQQSAGTKYKEGVYEVQDTPDYEGYYCKAKVTIANNQIVNVEWNIFDQGRKDRVFDETYEEVYAGNTVYQQQCRDNLKGAKTYGAKLIETQDLNKVDSISGATWSYKKFKKIMELALEQAK